MGRTISYGWQVAHEWDRDDRDDAEAIDHVSRSRAVRRHCHIACADLREPGGVRQRSLCTGNREARTWSCRFMSTAEAIGKT